MALVFQTKPAWCFVRAGNWTAQNIYLVDKTGSVLSRTPRGSQPISDPELCRLV